METKDKDLMRKLFDAMPDETLPKGLNEKIMHQIYMETAARGKRNNIWSILGYISGAVATFAVAIIILYMTGYNFELPQINTQTWSFPTPNFQIFKSQSFFFSLYIGILALFLLIADSTIRRHITKKEHAEN